MSEELSEHDDLAQALSASWDRSAAANAEPAAETPIEVPDGKITGNDPLAASDAAPEVEAPAPEPKPDADGRVRGPDGKFAPKTPPAEEVKGPAQPSGQPPPPPVATEPWQKPPQSFKPEAREEWAKVPPALQQEIHRRDRDHAVAIQRFTEQQRQVEPIMRAVQPFAQGLTQRGQSVPEVVSNFLRTEQALSHPDERVRAQVVAQALGTYRISVEALAAVLDAGPAAHQQPAPQSLGPDQVAQIVQSVLGQREQQSAHQRAQAEIASFQGEFLEDLKPAMAAMIQGGVAKDLQSAYDAACWADPRIRGILQQRSASTQAAKATASTQRAKLASSSVKSSPGSPTNGAPLDDSWEAHLSAAWDRQSQ